jgi:hypothetical protein
MNVRPFITLRLVARQRLRYISRLIHDVRPLRRIRGGWVFNHDSDDVQK